MKYKVGDKVRVREDLKTGRKYGSISFLKEMGKGQVLEVLENASENCYMLNDKYNLIYSPEMLRPVEFKIWCETEEEKQAVLEELEKEGYMWASGCKPTDSRSVFETPVMFYVENETIRQNQIKESFDFTPSEFTGIDFSEKIIITQTPDGAKAIYRDKTAEAGGNFSEASRKALSIVLCPFDVGDKARWGEKIVEIKKIIEKISEYMEVFVSDDECKRRVRFDELEPYEEQKYNARIFCVQSSGNFEKGKIYEVKDGMIKNRKVKDLVDLNNTFVAQFMEVVEGD